MNLSHKNIEIAKKLLKNGCKYCKYIKLDCLCYKYVVSLWLNYKKNSNSRSKYNRIICEVFEFHLNNKDDHAILYKSKNINDALVMYKINGKYINMIIQSFDVKNIKNSSFISVYV